MKQLEPGDTNLWSFVKDTKKHEGVWSKQTWLDLRKDQEREEPCATCGIMTCRRYVAALTGAGRSKFLFSEYIYQCESCRVTWCITRLQGRQENPDIYPQVREQEAAYLDELVA